MRRTVRSTSDRLGPTATSLWRLESLEPRQLLSTAFDLIGLTALRSDPRFAGVDGSGVTVAVLDAGVDSTNPILAPALRTSVDFVNMGPVASQHGTASASVIGSRDANIAVAPAADLVSLKVIADTSGPSTSYITQGLQWVLNNRVTYNIKVVNISLGDGNRYTVPNTGGYRTLINQLEAAGITVVSAAGNEYYSNQSQGVESPGIDSTLVVGSVWPDNVRRNVQYSSGAIDILTGPDRIAAFSERWTGSTFLFAPGANIRASGIGGVPLIEDGTSIAAPIVAGAVALIQDAAFTFAGRYLTPGEVRTILLSTADTIHDGDDEVDNVANTNLNYPRIDLAEALLQVGLQYGRLSVGQVQAQFIANPDGSGTLTATAINVIVGFTSLTSVDFYLDIDRNGAFSSNEFIGRDTTSGDGLTATYAIPANWAPGAYRFGAVVSNAAGQRGPTNTFTNTIKPNLAHRVFYAEGYANETTIDEFVPLVNPNGAAATYVVIAHYEAGPAGSQMDVVLETGTIAPYSRGGMQTSARNAVGLSLVRLNTPYALEVQSDLPLGAVLSHYDNFNPGDALSGVATGEAFSNVTRQSWWIPQVERRPGIVNDFLVLFNPGDSAINVTVTFIGTSSGSSNIDVNLSIRAQGRGGLAINDVAGLTNGTYGLVVTSTSPFTAALSHYVTDGTGDSSLGVPGNATGGLATTGVVPFVDRTSGITSTFVLFNPGSSRSTVTLTARSEDTTKAPIARTFEINARSVLRTDLLWATFGGVRPFHITYTSTQPVAGTIFQTADDRGDSVFDPTTNVTSTGWAIADGFLNRLSAGDTYFETLALTNPTAASFNVTVEYYLYDHRTPGSQGGQSQRVVQSVQLPARGMVSVQLHLPTSVPLQSSGPDLMPFAIFVRSSTPIYASFSHWDLFQGGGWSTFGTPIDVGGIGS